MLWSRERILVTGASGVLGTAVVDHLVSRKVNVIGCGRQSKPMGYRSHWLKVDLLTGEGLDAALSETTCVIHCASNPSKPREDVGALENLIKVAREKGRHIVYISIAGIEQAADDYEYYRVKLECEQRLARAGVGYTITRATPFHPFVSHLLKRLTLGPFLMVPKMTLQPVDPSFIAQRLVTHALNRHHGRTPDVAGPEIIDQNTLTADWMKSRHTAKVRISAPRLRSIRAIERLGSVAGEKGGTSWREWLSDL
ncbi:SDR family oxidoreductase [Pseudomonas sp. W4I3]|uniref:SDR family oxidoreductase n=1 Tax=Pseudomonas sp. W4I3 TaxID=3042294 RepID=UPI00278B74F2|nr:SDR family oxidoreductase [Pseudomonas sp. W4I3]MDQ0740291.1 uncharacterized protein YbjT (DUF2867 family) [Pseudomonas sp. W4I3]